MKPNAPKLWPKLWQISLVVPAPAAPVFEDALAGLSETVSRFKVGQGAWRLQALCRQRPDKNVLRRAVAAAAASSGIEVPAVAVETLAERDWLALNREQFPPVQAGRFFIARSHDGANGRGRRGRGGGVRLTLDAGPAFGSGTHESTRGCLLAIDRVASRRRFHKGLDLGCGSGILSLAMAAALKIPVVAADIDDWAVRTTAANVRANGLGQWVRVHKSNGLKASGVRLAAPYDLIVANILARPLVAMAPAIARHLARPGTVILAGLLRTQEAALVAAYRAQGLRLAGRIRIGGWSTLIFARGGR